MVLRLVLVLVVASIGLLPVHAQEEEADCSLAYLEQLTAWQAYLLGGRQGDQPARPDASDPCYRDRLRAQSDALTSTTPPAQEPPAPAVTEQSPLPGAAPPPPTSNTPSLTPDELLLSQFVVRVAELRLVPENTSARQYRDEMHFVLTYANNTGSDVRAFTGILVFRDLFDRQIQRVRLTYETPVPAGQTVTDRNKYVELNRFNADDQRFRNATMDNSTWTFEVTSLLFADGRRVGTPR